MAALSAESTARAPTPLICDRVHFAHDRGICLLDSRKKITPPTVATIFDGELRPLHTLGLAGPPSRARISSDGRYAATTVFVTGDNYSSSFSTRTTIIDVGSGEVVEDLERFAVSRDGRPFHEVDMNFWGVTFASDSNRFYATVATGSKTFLVEGDVSARTARVLHENVECPDLSPDQTRLAYKKHIDAETGWRLYTLDLATMKEAPIASETRSIDDQVEWLDDEHVLYGFIGEHGAPEEALNVWVSPAPKVPMEAPPEPVVYIHGASSPAVVH